MNRIGTLKGAAVVFGSSGIGAASVLLRSIIFARLLGPEQMGIAALAIAFYGLLAILTDTGFEKCLVQSPRGDSLTLQGTSHLFALVRGGLCALLTVGLLAPTFYQLNDPATASALMILGALFVIRGFAHADKWRYQRALRFGPAMLIDTASMTLSFLAAWPLAVWLQDYRAVVAALVLQGLADVAVSHFVAERRYRVLCDNDSVRELLAFGTPLLMAGVLMFVTMQGDRLVVASLFSHELLGLYAVAAGLAHIPTLLMIRAFNTLLLPRLARQRDDAAAFHRLLSLCSSLQSALALIVFLPFILGNHLLVTALYGTAFADASGALAWLAAAQMLRLMRSSTTLAALARGDSRNALTANLWRSLGLVPIYVLALLIGSLEAVGAGIVLAESLAFIASVRRLRRVQHTPLRLFFGPAFTVLLVATALSVLWLLLPRLNTQSSLIHFFALFCVSAIAGMCACALMPSLRLLAVDSFQAVRNWCDRPSPPSL